MQKRRLFFTILPFLIVLSGCTNTPDQLDDPLIVAQDRINNNDIEAGLKILENAMLDEPSRLELSNYYRDIASSNGEYERSINYFKEVVEGPLGEVDEMYYNLAFAYIDKIPSVGPMGAGFLSKRAIKQFQNVLDRDQSDWVSVYGIGMNYLHWPDYFKKNDSAVVYLERAEKLQESKPPRPYHILTFIRLGDAYAKNGRIDEAYAMWKQGLEQYPGHPDLLDRAKTPKGRIAEGIKQLYNPNNSIGEINTDISVLWKDNVPDELVPLRKNSLKQAGIGGLIKGSELALSAGDIGLFSWFMRNLPFLSDKSRFQNVDMSSLGINSSESTHDLASVVAHGMIMGFLSQFEEEKPSEARARADKLTSFERPFFHEGLGMGYAATASLDNLNELQSLISSLEGIDSRFTRLHLAGAGMWYGLESTNNSKVKSAFAKLGKFGEAYAYEGYGFAQALFHFKSNPDLIQGAAELGSSAARDYYHGVGRAFWILSGEDISSFVEKLSYVPEQYHSDAFSGYGMGIAFTRVENPNFVFSFLDNKPIKESREFLTGVTMGTMIRGLGDPTYVNEHHNLASAPMACRAKLIKNIGNKTFQKMEKLTAADFHSEWRESIGEMLNRKSFRDEWMRCL